MLIIIKSTFNFLRAHSDDIKGRVAALENAMTKTKFVTVTERPTMDKNDPNYGKPEEGTKTAERGKKAHSHVHKGKKYQTISLNIWQAAKRQKSHLTEKKNQVL